MQFDLVSREMRRLETERVNALREFHRISLLLDALSARREAISFDLKREEES